jgi:hypothetical protein
MLKFKMNANFEDVNMKVESRGLRMHKRILPYSARKENL